MKVRMTLKIVITTLMCFGLLSCGNGNQSSGGGGNNPTSKVGDITISNISTIPTGSHGQYVGQKFAVIVTNNSSVQMLLQKATYMDAQTKETKDANSEDSPINVEQCTRIQGRHGSCTISVKAPRADGQYVIDLKFLNPQTGTINEAKQIVSYSSDIPTTTTGVMYSSMNNSIYAKAGTPATMIVPFIITKPGGFSNLSVASFNNNPMVSPSIVCQGGTYTQGNACYVIARVAPEFNVAGARIASGFTVTSDLSAGSSSKHKHKHISPSSKVKIKAAVSYIFGVPLTVTNVTQGNLVTSAINISVNPANGTSPETVTLLNNGNASISNISIAANNPLAISSNGCSTLAAGASCTFDIDATSDTSGQASVLVNYNNGASSGNSNGSLAFNVYYISQNPTGTLDTAANGNLLNTPVNGTGTVTITVTNSTNKTLENLTFTSPTSSGAGGNAALSYETAANGSSCLTSGQKLAPSSKCSLILKFSPTSAISSTTFNLKSAADIVSGSTTVISSNLAISYSSVTGTAAVVIMPSYSNIAIRADGSDSFSESLTVTNFGGEDAHFDNISYPTPTPTALTIPDTGSTCTNSTVLTANQGSTCIINLKYGPTTSALSDADQKVEITYDNNVHTDRPLKAFARLDLQSSLAALVKVSAISASGTGVTGDGAVGTPYTFTNNPTTQGTFTVTYRNTGSATATDFNVALNTLPVGYEDTGSGTCATGTTTGSDLTAGSTCTAIFKAVQNNGNTPGDLYNPYSFFGSMPFNVPGFSYTDTNTGLNTNSNPACDNSISSGCGTAGSLADQSTVYVTPTSLSTTVSQGASGPFSTGGSSGSNPITFTGGTDGVKIVIPTTSTTFYPVQQLPHFAAGTANSRTCTFTGGTCTMPIEHPVGTPATTYDFIYLVIPSGGDATTLSGGIIQSGTITYSD